MANEKLENLNIIQELKPRAINLDADPIALKPFEAKFIKNLRSQVSKQGNPNSGTSTTEGDNKEVLVPLLSTLEICNPNLPAGQNTTIGTYESVSTNEIYWLVYN